MRGCNRRGGKPALPAQLRGDALRKLCPAQRIDKGEQIRMSVSVDKSGGERQAGSVDRPGSRLAGAENDFSVPDPDVRLHCRCARAVKNRRVLNQIIQHLQLLMPLPSFSCT